MNNIINVAFQIVPKGTNKGIYELVDKAIEVIQKSGLKYKVCPFETVIEGKYEEVMKVIYNAQKACLDSGAYEFLAYIKMQVNKERDVHLEEKMHKY